MKTINKIVIVQLGFFAGEVICYMILNDDIFSVITNHIVLTIGYLYGFWQSKN